MSLCYTLSEAKTEDIDALALLEEQCFTDPWSKAAFEETLCDASYCFVTAKLENGMLIGYAGLYAVLDEAHIVNVAVSPAYRRMGIADALLSSLYEKAVDAAMFFLEVRVSNCPARKLYQKHGFREVGIRKNYYRLPTEDAILMTKVRASDSDDNLVSE